MVTMSSGRGFVKTFMSENSFKGLFGSRKEQETSAQSQDEGSEGSPSSRPRKYVKELSSLANVLTARCASTLSLSIEELQQQFEDEVSESSKSPSKYARSLLEYCCFKGLAVATQVSDYLSDKEFRRHTFEMMLAWETPGAADKPIVKVDVESAVGKQAFTRMGPAISGAADPVTVHSQFDALTASTAGRLPFSAHDKYLGELDKTIKAMKNQSISSHLTKSELVKGENVIEIDGTVTTQPVLQHAGVSTWPGRLTLTDHALYFESIGVVSYDKPKKFDLAANLHQTVKPELTGPWGARLFDKAISCKSDAISEVLVFEFPEFTGHARRDYWLVIIREVICAHQFIRKYHLKAGAKDEALSRAVLGIARLRATREVTHGLPPKPESLLTFVTGEELPGGDLIMEALAQSLLGETESSSETVVNEKLRNRPYSRSARATLASFGASTLRGPANVGDGALSIGEFLIGDLNPLEKAVMQSRDTSKKVELAQSTIDGVKVDGIETNMAVMKELLIPLSATVQCIQSLQSWNEPFKTTTFIIICSYIIFRNLIGYTLPVCLLGSAGFMLWFRQGQTENSGELKVTAPANQSTVEQLLALQQGLSQLKELIQSSNIFLLKIRAIIFSTIPQATDQVVIGLIVMAFILLLLPLKVIVLLIFWEIFTRQMPSRRLSTERCTRRLREWWYGVPVVPVRLTKVEEEKKKK